MSDKLYHIFEVQVNEKNNIVYLYKIINDMIGKSNREAIVNSFKIPRYRKQFDMLAYNDVADVYLFEKIGDDTVNTWGKHVTSKLNLFLVAIEDTIVMNHQEIIKNRIELFFSKQKKNNKDCCPKCSSDLHFIRMALVCKNTKCHNVIGGI